MPDITLAEQIADFEAILNDIGSSEITVAILATLRSLVWHPVSETPPVEVWLNGAFYGGGLRDLIIGNEGSVPSDLEYWRLALPGPDNATCDDTDA